MSTAMITPNQAAWRHKIKFYGQAFDVRDILDILRVYCIHSLKREANFFSDTLQYVFFKKYRTCLSRPIMDVISSSKANGGSNYFY